MNGQHLRRHLNRVAYGFRRYFWLSVLICTAPLGLVLSSGCSEKGGVVPPHQFPFDVSHQGNSICEDVRITESKPYLFYLAFFYQDESERAKMMDILGTDTYDEKKRPRLVVSVQLEIYELKESNYMKMKFKDVIVTNGNNSIGISASYNGYSSRIISYVDLDPGIYTACVKSMDDIPFFNGKKVALGISWSHGLK